MYLFPSYVSSQRFGSNAAPVSRQISEALGNALLDALQDPGHVLLGDALEAAVAAVVVTDTDAVGILKEADTNDVGTRKEADADHVGIIMEAVTEESGLMLLIRSSSPSTAAA
ncbi:hypothetical protein PG994_004736 [Apiospora phragmitis]|uniref:Uncharacterized protein n=1 Tax=Apiospora phragmitis TaxID=2905665 RepID=A0ABR1VSM6_9PEZI